MNDLWVAEYSVSQGCFHIHTVESMMKKNLSAIVERRSSDYLPFAVCKNSDEANRACDLLGKKLGINR